MTEVKTITDDGVAKMKAREGIPMPRRSAFNDVASADAIRRYVRGIGDLNPLFTDRSRAETTRWGGLVAPPYFVETMGRSRHTEIPPEIKQRGRGALAGVHQFYAGNRMRRYLPVFEGDRLWTCTFITDVEEKQSALAERAVHFVRRQVWENDRGQVVAIADRLLIAGGREGEDRKRTKYSDLVEATYTAEAIEAIDDSNLRERRSLLNPIEGPFWEDVSEGEKLPTVVRGPLTVTDIVAYSMGRGSPYIKGAHGWAVLDRREHPGSYWTNMRGIPDITECVHWDGELAQKTGNPMPYDYGGQRTDWLGSLLTNWCGASGFISELDIQLREFNYIGDTTWCKGSVVEKWQKGSDNGIEVEIYTEDQRGRITARGTAQILLPSRVAGPVRLNIITIEEVAAEPARLEREWAKTSPREDEYE